jgi:hypothetical protein
MKRLHSSGNRLYQPSEVRFAEGERVTVVPGIFPTEHVGLSGTIVGVPPATSPVYVVKLDWNHHEQTLAEHYLVPEATT